MDNLIKKYIHEGCVTERLKLRPLKMDDAKDMFEYTSNPETCMFLKWGPHTVINETQQFIEKAIHKYREPKDILWGIEYDDKLIGVIRIYNIDIINRECEISYILNRKFEGKGFMTESINRVIKFCFNELRLIKVKAFYDSENISSLNVMLRCNMIKSLNNVGKVEIKGQLRQLKMCEIGKEL